MTESSRMILMMVLLMVEGQQVSVPTECRAEYTEGSLSKPCTLCTVCAKDWDAEKRTSRPMCQKVEYTYDYHRAVDDGPPLEIAYSGGQDVCIPVDFCKYKDRFKCEDSQSEKVQLQGSCKCQCNQSHYGQLCNYTIPSGLSINSFADVQNIVYIPLAYVHDYATIYMYFYTTGADLQVEVQTETEILRYNADSCRTDVPPITELCTSIWENNGVSNYLSVCSGGPTYVQNKDNSVCAVIVNLAFSRDKVTDLNRHKFIFNNEDGLGKKFDLQVAMKIEAVNVKVSNSIPNLYSGVVLNHKYGVTVIYSSDHQFEHCPLLVTIPQYSRKSGIAPSFPRSQEISLSNKVVLMQVPGCDNLGDPDNDWVMWVLKVNHDEKNDPPFLKRFQTSTLVFEPFSLPFGKYKVKNMVRFIKRNFDMAFAHCYFEVVSVPLRPLIFGGSMRYIYYKSDLTLISDELVDPNYSRTDQPNITRFWNCDDIADRLCDQISTNELTITKPGPFKPGKVYNFTMAVKSPLLPLETCNQIIIISKDNIPNLLIECLRNCGGKGFKSDTREILYFKVKNSLTDSNELEENYSYNWKYSTEGSSFVDVTDIKQEEETPSWILVVNENSLYDNKEYIFKATGGGVVPGEAQITVKTFKYTNDFKCSIKPSSGIAVETKFTIECNKAKFEQNQHLALTIYFYDKYKTEDEVGRLLGTNYLELVEDIVLTRGTVAVQATNIYGQFQQTHVTASLTFPKLTPEFVDENMNKLHSFSENGGYNQKLSFVSSLCDILNKDPSLKDKYTETFLEVIKNEEAIDLVHLELILSATQSVICQENNCAAKNMSDRSYKLLGEILVDVSDIFSKEIIRTTEGDSEIPSTKLNLIYQSLLKCSGICLSIENKNLIDETSKTLDYNIYNLYKSGNLKLLNSLEKVNEALVKKNIPFLKRTSIQTELIETWMKDDFPIYFTNGTKKDTNGSYLVFTKNLAKSLKKRSYHIVVQLMSFKSDPFWWSQTVAVSTEVVSIAISYTKDFHTYNSVNLFSSPIDIFLKKNANANVTVSGSVTQPDAAEDIYMKDQAVNVHKIYPRKGEKITIKFNGLNGTDAFRVVVMKNLRPDYDLVQKGVEVNASSPWYHSARELKVTKKDDVLFVGILPGVSVPVNETRSYQFELQSARCQVWYSFLWDTSGCYLGPNSTNEYLHCQCTHLSSVAGFIGVPINTINPINDYNLFLSLPDNPYVFILVFGILLIYIMLLVWACKMNQRDVQQAALIVLEDNITGDDYAYLVIVFTGSRLYAGTTSKIGIILHGSDASSRSHLLISSKRPTLKRNNDDWFLLYAPKHLGVISSVQLWSDHSGSSPNWFCDRVHVQDLDSNRDYSFLIGKWFGVTQRGARMECFSRTVKLDKEEHITEFVMTNIVFGFRENHMWVSFLSRHPRSPMTRAQRLSLAVVALFTCLLTCILFYEATMPEDEDIQRYSVSVREVIISMYTICITVAVTAVVYFAFSKSYRLETDESGEARRSRHSSRQTGHVQVDSVDALTQEKLAKRNFKFYFKKAILNLRKEDFYPVNVSTGRNAEQVIVHRTRLILAWTLCTSVIFLCCLFTIWIGLKMGKKKSLLWLTAIGMTIFQDNFVVDPVKIVILAFLFGIVQTQLCDLYSYDTNIYDVRKSILRHINRDHFIHSKRLQYVYKPASIERLTEILNQLRIVRKWWALIDITDIFFSITIVLFIIEHKSMHNDYFYTNTIFKNIIFNKIIPSKNIIHSTGVNNVSEYSIFLQDSIFEAIYTTQWYNKKSLNEPGESFPGTGWAKTLTHRMVGVPRLRQIRVMREPCNIPTVLRNLSLYCNVLYSPSVEDTEYYNPQWENYTQEYVDVIFEKSPWIYTYPDEVSAFGVTDFYSETGKWFHGGGYVAELTRTRRRTSGTLLNLADLGWLDMRTRIIFFEMSLYNVNNNVFTTMIFTTEHLGSSRTLVGHTVRCIMVEQENVMFEVLYVIFSICLFVKLLMVLNTLGPQVFFTSFWTWYDLCFAVVGFTYFIAYRVILEIFSEYINEFQRGGKEDFFPFSGLFFTSHLDRYIIGLLLIFATVRSLRLLQYGAKTISEKYKYTLYFSWPQILCVTFVLTTFTISLQYLVAHLVHSQYSLGVSHWLQHKMNFIDLRTVTVSSKTNIFDYLPCGISCLGMLFYIMILIEAYSRAEVVYINEKMNEVFDGF